MRVRIEFFGKLGDHAGAANREIELPPHITDTAGLRVWLDESQGFQGALTHPSVQLARGDEAKQLLCHAVGDPLPGDFMESGIGGGFRHSVRVLPGPRSRGQTSELAFW